MKAKIGMLLCYCGQWNDIYEEDLGFEEFECDCGLTMSVPEDPRDFQKWNDKARQEMLASTFTGKVRVMAVQETGEETCVVDDLDEQLSYIVESGVRVEHPEYRLVFSEPVLRVQLRNRNSEL